MDSIELLNWARGPAFNTALAIFVFGMLLRLFEVLSLGQKMDLSEPRGSGISGGGQTILKRSLPRQTVFMRESLRIINGYVFHLGFFAVLLLYRPHIEIFDAILGVSWSGLPSGVIDAITAITIVSLVVALFMRINSPVLSLISTSGDYVVWLVTFLPFVTGYMAYNHLVPDYGFILAIHILTVELLLIIAPFTKLTHMFSFMLARWYQGCIAGRRGVES